MAELTADELRAAITRAYAEFTGELAEHGQGWERKPADGKEGEDAWCARQVAEHLAGAAGFFGSGIAKAIGVEGPAMQRYALATAADAIKAMPIAHAGLIGVVNQVEDGHLPIEVEFGPLGKTTVGNVIGIIAYHYRDHAAQLRTLREGSPS